MKNIFTLLFFSAIVGNTSAQLNIQCEGRDRHSLYVLLSGYVYRLDNVGVGTLSLVSVQSTPGLSGISINPNFTEMSTDMTMYGCTGGEYYYWNGSGWTNTHHSTGNGTAINPGGSTNRLYNYDGYQSTIYQYNGRQNGSLLMSAPNVKSWDMACDSSGNFFLTYSNMIVAYSPNGIPMDTLYPSGLPGGNLAGFAILNSRMYIISGLALYEGIVSPDGNNVAFSQIYYPFPVSASDLASCPDASSSSVIITGFKNPEAPHFIIYPNPANDHALIKLDNTASIQVNDCLGKIIFAADVSGFKEYDLDVSAWPHGVYFVTARSAQGQVGHTKLSVK